MSSASLKNVQEGEVTLENQMTADDDGSTEPKSKSIVHTEEKASLIDDKYGDDTRNVAADLEPAPPRSTLRRCIGRLQFLSSGIWI